MNESEKTEFLNKVVATVTEAVKVTVNGKIDRIHKMLENQNEIQDAHHKKVADHIYKFDEHTCRVEPVIKRYEDEQAVIREAKRKAEEADVKALPLTQTSKYILSIGVLGGAFAWLLNKFNIHF